MSWNIIPATLVIIGTFMVVKLMYEKENYIAAALIFTSGLEFAERMLRSPKIEKNNSNKEEEKKD